MKKLLITTLFLIFTQTSFASFDYILGVENENKILQNKASILDLDVLDNDKNLIKKLKKKNKFLIGYINAGAIENYREDYKKIPKKYIGKTYPDWEDERFLDIKNYKFFSSFFIKYLDIAKQKGFDAVEFDNIDTYDNFEETGFKITKQDELNFLDFLEKETHKRGMKIYQKNAGELTKNLVKKFDGAIVEDGFVEKSINNFLEYQKYNKKIFDIEYLDNFSQKDFIEKVCPKAKKLNIETILKNRDLDDFILTCPKKNFSKNKKNLKQKINKKLDNFYKKIEKKYNKEKQKIILKKVLEKINFLKKQKRFKNKIYLLEIIEKYFLEKQKEISIVGNKNILYKTDFENINLKEKIADIDGVWWQKFSDPKINILGYETQLQFIVDGKSDINKFAKTSIKETIGKNGKKTKALHLEIIKKQTENTQIPLITYTDGKEIQKMNIKYSLKFPKNLAEKLGKNGWAVISEFKTTSDFRLAIYVYADENKKLYWYMHGDNVVDEPKNYQEFWFRENKNFMVPVGEWFDVNIFWERGVTNGKVDFLVNNKNVLNYRGKTKIKDNLNAIMYFTNYASNPIDIWIDNFEVSQNNISKNITKNKKLIAKKDKIYFGAFQEFGGGETEVSTQKLKNFEKLIGKKPAFAYFSQDFSEEKIKFPKESVEKIIGFGEIPFIRLMPSMVYEKNKKTYNLKDIYSHKFDKELRIWAREAKKINSPIMIDFAVEANGNWFFYSNKPQDFKKAYRHIIDIFREEKVDNITWFFHFNLQSFPNKSWNKPKNYYPGDDYIDWIGFSLYGAQSPYEENIDFKEILSKNYKDILYVSKNKPIALIEFGVADFNENYKKEIWLKNTFETIIKNPYIKFSMISIWSEKWEEENYFSDLRINSSKKSLEVYKKYLKKEIFDNNLKFKNYLDKIGKSFLE